MEAKTSDSEAEANSKLKPSNLLPLTPKERVNNNYDKFFQELVPKGTAVRLIFLR